MTFETRPEKTVTLDSPAFVSAAVRFIFRYASSTFLNSNRFFRWFWHLTWLHRFLCSLRVVWRTRDPERFWQFLDDPICLFWWGNYFPDTCPNLQEESEVRLSLSHYHQRSGFQSSDNGRAIKNRPGPGISRPTNSSTYRVSNAWLNCSLKGFEVELSNRLAFRGEYQTSRHCASAHWSEGQALVFSFSTTKQNKDVAALSIF